MLKARSTRKVTTCIVVAALLACGLSSSGFVPGPLCRAAARVAAASMVGMTLAPATFAVEIGAEAELPFAASVRVRRTLIMFVKQIRILSQSLSFAVNSGHRHNLWPQWNDLPKKDWDAVNAERTVTDCRAQLLPDESSVARKEKGADAENAYQGLLDFWT